MAKPQILGALRVNGTTYTAGQENELARVLSQNDGARHIENGLLAGDWEFGGEVGEPDSGGNSQSQIEELRAEIEKQTELVTQLSAQNEELKTENSRLANIESALMSTIEELRAEIEKAHETPIADNEFGATLRKIVSAPVASVLLKSGFDSAEKIAAASDKELEDLDGVATGSIEKLRAQFGANADSAKGE